MLPATLQYLQAKRWWKVRWGYNIISANGHKDGNATLCISEGAGHVSFRQGHSRVRCRTKCKHGPQYNARFRETNWRSKGYGMINPSARGPVLLWNNSNTKKFQRQKMATIFLLTIIYRITDLILTLLRRPYEIVQADCNHGVSPPREAVCSTPSSIYVNFSSNDELRETPIQHAVHWHDVYGLRSSLNLSCKRNQHQWYHLREGSNVPDIPPNAS